jgi:PAS domain S-box-containing protein
MGRGSDVRRFLRSRTGLAFCLFLLFSAAVSAGLASAFHRLSLASFTASKSEEKVTALQLVDAFVNDYAELRARLGAADAPVPASFRAHSIEVFNHARAGKPVLGLRWVGRPGRFIKTPPSDPAMAAVVEGFARKANPQPWTGFLEIGGKPVFRTVYPSFANHQSCADCHNRLQPGQSWRLGDLMGAFSVDVPAGPFLRKLDWECLGAGAMLFLGLAMVGFAVSLLHYRQLGEREAAQALLADSERRFRDFAEASSDWFWEQDEDLRISFVSENDVSKRLGSTPGNQIGKLRWEVVTLGVSDERKAAHQADLEARRPFHRFRFQRIDIDGQLRHVELNGKPVFDGAGVFRGYRGTARDITGEVANEIELARRVEERTEELRRVQAELLRNERLSTLGQFTATVAHELRNPLSAIRNTAFAIAEVAAANGLKLERPLGRLERSIARCDRMIADLLEYTRVRDLERVRVRLDDWLGEVLDEQHLPEGISLVRDLGVSGLVADLDPDRVRRVVINLVENASQALAEAGPVAGRERMLTVGTRDLGGGGVEIRFIDTGPGIAPEVLPKVFDPLFSTKSFGTGLGLPTVRQIVEQHGGTVEIASTPGSGTQVRVVLPLPAAAQDLAA